MPETKAVIDILMDAIKELRESEKEGREVLSDYRVELERRLTMLEAKNRWIAAGAGGVSAAVLAAAEKFFLG